MTRWVFLCLLMPAMFLLGCGESGTSGDVPYAGAIEFVPLTGTGTGPDSDVEVEVPTALQMEVFAGGLSRNVIIDTGSIYYFLGSPDNSKDLSCSSPETFTYGSGEAVFCPEKNKVEVKTLEGAYQPLRSNELKMGSCHLNDWPDGAPPAIMGLSGNLTGKNRKGMASMIQQLKPDYLSFSFPEGMTKRGFFQFDKLPEDAAAAFPPIPLVDPGSAEYGYTARPLRVEFWVDGEVHTILRNTVDGVLLETESSIDRVADEFLTFFDTGTTLPIALFDGVSLLGDQVGKAYLMPESSAVGYDSMLVVFEGESGEEIFVESGDLRFWINNSPFAKVPTKAVFSGDVQEFLVVMGLNFIARFDFQFDFERGEATHITFVER